MFGSKIDESTPAKHVYYTVRNVLSPELLILDSGMKIKLLGVKSNPAAAQKAMDYLIEKTKSQKVYIKFDKTIYDENNNLLCYLYLKNKTFINAHLIMLGLAQPDETIEHKYLNKFTSARRQS